MPVAKIDVEMRLEKNWHIKFVLWSAKSMDSAHSSFDKLRIAFLRIIFFSNNFFISICAAVSRFKCIYSALTRGFIILCAILMIISCIFFTQNIMTIFTRFVSYFECNSIVTHYHGIFKLFFLSMYSWKYC